MKIEVEVFKVGECSPLPRTAVLAYVDGDWVECQVRGGRWTIAGWGDVRPDYWMHYPTNPGTFSA